jgi:hypothetical protein
MHSGLLADPLNKIVKEMKKISGKRGKTEADMEELAKLEWKGSLYIDKNEIVIPGEVIEACFINGSKKKKLGQQAKAGSFCDGHAVLDYKGKPEKLDLEKLWKAGEHRFMAPVIVSRSRVMRCRPRFEEWSATFNLHFNDEMLNPSDVLEILRIAGEQIGLCDWRPRFGRFTASAVN